MGVGDTKETRLSRHNKTDAYKNSQRLCHQAQSLQRYRPNVITALRGEVDTRPHL